MELFIDIILLKILEVKFVLLSMRLVKHANVCDKPNTMCHPEGEFNNCIQLYKYIVGLVPTPMRSSIDMVIRSRRLSKDNTYYALKQKIIDSELEPNQPVHEENLAALLGVSRTPLREAIQRLENEDFLVRQPNGRLRVASITHKEVEEIFLIRSMLEGYIARSAAKHATDKDILNLTTIVKKMKHSFHLGDNQNYVTYGFEFHDYLSEISELTTFEKVLNQLRDHSLRYCRFVSMHGDWNIQADDEHELILQMITDHNEDGAEQAMRDHIFSSLSTAIEHIKGIEEKLEA